VKKQYFLLALVVLIISSCLTHQYLDHSFRQTYVDHRSLLHIDSIAAPYLKLHFENGDVALLESWNYSELADSVKGQGHLYDFNRRMRKFGELSIHVNDIVLVESNRLDKVKDRTPESLGQLRILAGVDAALGALCIAIPKSCFGSCPTFYIKGEEDLSQCRAESFSEAIMPSMSSTDIDALHYSSREHELELVMKNEALETHVIDKITLLSVVRGKDELVFVDGQDRFYKCQETRLPQSALLGDESVLQELSGMDELVLRTRTDADDLMVLDTIELVFDNSEVMHGGLVLQFKQSLLTTYLFYHALSLLGDDATDQMAKIESGKLGTSALFEQMIDFGSIRIFQEHDNSWQRIGTISEIGPIAQNLEVVPLQPTAGEEQIKIKLIMTRGFWLLNYVGLTPMIEEVFATSYSPSSMDVIYGSDGLNLDQITDEDDLKMVTHAYDEVSFRFCLDPIGQESEHEFFISATGYYLEWMRKDWMRDKDPKSFYKMIKLDKEYWSQLAREYKLVEAQMDEHFWQTNHKRPEEI